ncbi:MAG TPA: RNA polymerase sigma factor [Casimicrobiaceae bacterium]|nr:RNA polymerase sigma factor [Casimicrobiaceae bacterium]
MDDLSTHAPRRLADGAAADAALMARVVAGEAAALDPLYRRHKSIVYRFALLWSGSPAIAADVTQDVFVHVLTRARDFDGARGALSPWLIGIARNFVRQRTGTREVAFDDDADAPFPQSIEETTPHTTLALRQDLERLRRAIAALPPHYRDVLVLVELAERSYAEVAAICGCELNTVRSRLFRARALLARWLALDASADERWPTLAGSSL